MEERARNSMITSQGGKWGAETVGPEPWTVTTRKGATLAGKRIISETETASVLVDTAFSKPQEAANFTHTGNSPRAKVISKVLVLIKGPPKSICHLPITTPTMLGAPDSLFPGGK